MKVLVVDDNERIRDLIVSLLKQTISALEVDECASAEQAINLIKYQKPDIILMDIIMGTIDGISATRFINESNPEIKIIIISQLPEQEYKQEALTAGAIEYVNKENLFQLTTLIQGIK